MDKIEKGKKKAQAFDLRDMIHDYSFEPHQLPDPSKRHDITNNFVPQQYLFPAKQVISKQSSSKCSEDFPFNSVWESLSNTAIEKIFMFLDLRSACRFLQTCKQVHSYSNKTCMWKIFMPEFFGMRAIKNMKSEPSSGYEYMMLHKGLCFLKDSKFYLSSEALLGEKSKLRIRELTSQLCDFASIQDGRIHYLAQRFKPEGSHLPSDLKLSWNKKTHEIFLWLSNQQGENMTYTIIRKYQFTGKNVIDVYFLEDQYVVVEHTSEIELQENGEKEQGEEQNNSQGIKKKYVQTFLIIEMSRVFEVNELESSEEKGSWKEINFEWIEASESEQPKIIKHNEYRFEIVCSSKRERLLAKLFENHTLLFYTKSKVSCIVLQSLTENTIIGTGWVNLNFPLKGIIKRRNGKPSEQFIMIDQAINLFIVSSKGDALVAKRCGSLSEINKDSLAQKEKYGYSHGFLDHSDPSTEYLVIYRDSRFYILHLDDMRYTFLFDISVQFDNITSWNTVGIHLVLQRGSSFGLYNLKTGKSIHSYDYKPRPIFCAEYTYKQCYYYHNITTITKIVNEYDHEKRSIHGVECLPTKLILTPSYLIILSFPYHNNPSFVIDIQPLALIALTTDDYLKDTSLLSYQASIEVAWEGKDLPLFNQSYKKFTEDFARLEHIIKFEQDKLMVYYEPLNFFLDLNVIYNREKNFPNIYQTDRKKITLTVNPAEPQEQKSKIIPKNPFLRIPENYNRYYYPETNQRKQGSPEEEKQGNNSKKRKAKKRRNSESLEPKEVEKPDTDRSKSANKREVFNSKLRAELAKYRDPYKEPPLQTIIKTIKKEKEKDRRRANQHRDKFMY